MRDFVAAAIHDPEPKWPVGLTTLAKRYAALRLELSQVKAAASALIAKIEWCAYDETDSTASQYCPDCGETKENGHDVSNCALAELRMLCAPPKEGER